MSWHGRRPSADELAELLARHRLWLVSSGVSGVKGNLEGADLRRVDLGVANLERVNLRGADLAWASLEGANLRRADLGRANLSGASLRGAVLERAALVRASLETANLQAANLAGASLGGASLRGTLFQGASLRGANLERADLQGADLQGADLQGANLREAFLHGARLQDAQLEGAKLSRASLEGASWNAGTRFPSDFEAPAPGAARSASGVAGRLPPSSPSQDRPSGCVRRAEEALPEAEPRVALRFEGEAEPRTLQALTRELATWTDYLSTLAHLQQAEPLFTLGRVGRAPAPAPFAIEVIMGSAAMMVGLAAVWQASAVPTPAPLARARYVELAAELELPLDPSSEQTLRRLVEGVADARRRGVELSLSPSAAQLAQCPRLRELCQALDRERALPRQVEGC